MATVVLSAVGSAVGGSVGGSLLGIGSAVIGQATGAIAGSFVDQKLLGSGSAVVETGKARSLRIQTSTEGTTIPLVFGRSRVAGQIIWSTRFKENRATTVEQGGKGNPGRSVTEFSYSISLGIGLCEGPVRRVGRVWADGKLLDLRGINHRIYLGSETQMPDEKIEAVEGASRVPAYRGLAYVVFEDFPVSNFGNRIPQFNFEVFRAPQAELDGPEAGTPLPELIQAVNLSPGTGEFALDPTPVRQVNPGGGGSYLNINNTAGLPDYVAALDQLESELPECDGVSLIVSWFGDDLRCGHCRVEPRVEEPGRTTSPAPWQSAGLDSSTARTVSRGADDRVNFGGTPDDGSIIRAIEDLKARGKVVTLYPFLLMDIPSGNGLPDPYGGTEQGAFSWRGRITLDVAPGQTGSTDKTAAAAADVAAFFGQTTASDYQVGSGSVSYTGPNEWTWNRFVLHLAALGAAAGGVDAICIGTELRGLTTIRSSTAGFPAVDALRALAAEVRALLPAARITYAADWSEYFGYHPNDGSGDVLFHLDPLWADPAIDAVGIDDYLPLSDWRHGTAHADIAEKSVYSLEYLSSQVEGGEHYDYYYEDDAGRTLQNRLPITDGTYGEPWVFRPKDIRNWWSSPHHNRIGGVRQSAPTEWVPMSKPVWLTETGCPAADLGANMPNLFLDEKSSESGLPPGSRGARDDEMQRRFLQAKLGYWQDSSNNPISPVYGGRMIPSDRVFVWTWDARPWPDFPVRTNVWADGPSHRLGHWITGRANAGALALVIADICLRSGLDYADFDVSEVYGSVDGYLLERTQSAREALQPLMQIYAVDAFESGGVLIFRSRGFSQITELSAENLIEPNDGNPGPVRHETGRETELVDQVRLSYALAESDYRIGAAETRLPDGDLLRVSETSLPIVLASSRAQQVVERWLSESNRANVSATFALPPSAISHEPGDLISLPGQGSTEIYRIDRVTDSEVREVEATRTETTLYLPTVTPERGIEPDLITVGGPLDVVVMDLPIADGSERDHQPWIAATAEPWPGDVAVFKSATGSNFRFAQKLLAPATIGRSLSELPAGKPDRWHNVDWDVLLPTGSVISEDPIDVFNGSNVLAIEHPGGWEMLQFEQAVLTSENTYRLSRLLRGQRGTGYLSAQAVASDAKIVVINEAVQPLAVTAAECGLSRIWRIGPAKFNIAHETYQDITHVPACTGLKPFAPAHLEARLSNGDVDVHWIRTDRIGGGSFETAEVPLSEEREQYRVTIRSGATVVREAMTDVPEYTYLQTEQILDGASGQIEISVQQFSHIIGFGTERTVSINV